MVVEEEGGGEPLYVYSMSRLRGITHLDFILAHGFPENSPDNRAWRENLIRDIAHFLALSWKAPLPVSPDVRNSLERTYTRDLRLLQAALPPRFQPVIQTCLGAMNDILSLPIVLLHRDLNSSNIIVDETTCHLVGVIDWAEAEACPFGLNLHSLQTLTGKLHLRNGWTRYEDYDTLQDLFWTTFLHEVGSLSEDELRTIKLARVLGLLLSEGFTSRLEDQPTPVPIGDDEKGRYNMLSLDGFLINPQTRFDNLESLRH
ncbi:hypothetical protein F4778DRAFT_714669 [Xylariomycetidae sp. FL2044]|nr:hypothetical protein F4778DRAFT_714669 [Xylariomycetidae sp. FL2044]